MLNSATNSHNFMMKLLIFHLYAMPIFILLIWPFFTGKVPAGFDVINSFIPFQNVGIDEVLSGNVTWTNKIGLGYPIVGDLEFQQFSVFSFLQLVTSPLIAYHLKTCLLLLIVVFNVVFVLPRVLNVSIIESIAPLMILMVFFMNNIDLMVQYNMVFVSSLSFLPILAYSIKKYLLTPRLWSYLIANFCVIELLWSQYNFTAPFNLVSIMAIYVAISVDLWLKKKLVISRFVVLVLPVVAVCVYVVPQAYILTTFSNKYHHNVPNYDLAVVITTISNALNMLTRNLLFFAAFLTIFIGIILYLFARRYRNKLYSPHWVLLFIIAVLFVAYSTPYNIPWPRVKILLIPAYFSWLFAFYGQFIRHRLKNISLRSVALSSCIFITIWSVYHQEAKSVFRYSFPVNFYNVSKNSMAYLIEKYGILKTARFATVVDKNFQYSYDSRVQTKGKHSVNLDEILYHPGWSPLLNVQELGYYSCYLINDPHFFDDYVDVINFCPMNSWISFISPSYDNLNPVMLKLAGVNYLISRDKVSVDSFKLLGFEKLNYSSIKNKNNNNHVATDIFYLYKIDNNPGYNIKLSNHLNMNDKVSIIKKEIKKQIEEKRQLYRIAYKEKGSSICIENSQLRGGVMAIILPVTYYPEWYLSNDNKSCILNIFGFVGIYVGTNSNRIDIVFGRSHNVQRYLALTLIFISLVGVFLLAYFNFSQ
jgi:hypothetical protein